MVEMSMWVVCDERALVMVYRLPRGEPADLASIARMSLPSSSKCPEQVRNCGGPRPHFQS